MRPREFGAWYSLDPLKCLYSAIFSNLDLTLITTLSNGCIRMWLIDDPIPHRVSPVTSMTVLPDWPLTLPRDWTQQTQIMSSMPVLSSRAPESSRWLHPPLLRSTNPPNPTPSSSSSRCRKWVGWDITMLAYYIYTNLLPVFSSVATNIFGQQIQSSQLIFVILKKAFKPCFFHTVFMVSGYLHRGKKTKPSNNSSSSNNNTQVSSLFIRAPNTL